MARSADHPEMPPTADQLLATFRAGYQALGELLQRHRNYLLKICTEELDPKLNAVDGPSGIVQQVFLNVVEDLNRKTKGLLAVKDEKDFRKWLRRVCINTLHKHERDRKRGKRDVRREQPQPQDFDQPAGGPSPSSVYRQGEEIHLLEAAINSLPEADRMLLRLAKWRSFSSAELSELLDGHVTDNGRKRVHRRLANLYVVLSKNEQIKGMGS